MTVNFKINSVVVILKVTERCNINCSYCYFFNGSDSSFKNHAARISLQTVENVAKYFKKACEKLSIKNLRFDFHGGEPLLLKPEYLSSICNILIQELSETVKVEFTLQTNAMLINEEWIRLFSFYHINLGISIDGPEEYHDKYRYDHKGKGTYVRTREAINLLRSHAKRSKLNFGVGVLSVINPDFSAKKIYRHFVDELKLNSFDFLLPDNTWDSFKKEDFYGEKIGFFLKELFDEWAGDNNPKIYVRILNSIISSLLGLKLHFHDLGGWLEDLLLVTVNSDGGIGPDDTYRSADPNFMQLGLTVTNSTLEDLLAHPTIKMLISSSKNVPDHCQTCNWVKTCKGGSLLHRYSSSNNFNNPSVYCDGLKYFFDHIYRFIETHEIKIVRNGKETV